jgi:hypothetical protein
VRENRALDALRDARVTIVPRSTDGGGAPASATVAD